MILTSGTKSWRNKMGLVMENNPSSSHCFKEGFNHIENKMLGNRCVKEATRQKLNVTTVSV